MNQADASAVALVWHLAAAAATKYTTQKRRKQLTDNLYQEKKNKNENILLRNTIVNVYIDNKVK